MEIEEKYEKESKYNAGLAQIERLNVLWLKATSSTERADFRHHLIILNRVWMELVCDMKPVEKANGITLQNNISKSLCMKAEVGMKLAKIWSSLRNYEEFLRQCQNNQGKGAAYRNLDDESIE